MLGINSYITSVSNINSLLSCDKHVVMVIDPMIYQALLDLPSEKNCHLQHNIIGHTFSSPSQTLLFLPFLFYTSHNGLHWKEEGVETTQTCVYYGRIT